MNVTLILKLCLNFCPFILSQYLVGVFKFTFATFPIVPSGSLTFNLLCFYTEMLTLSAFSEMLWKLTVNSVP